VTAASMCWSRSRPEAAILGPHQLRRSQTRVGAHLRQQPEDVAESADTRLCSRSQMIGDLEPLKRVLRLANREGAKRPASGASECRRAVDDGRPEDPESRCTHRTTSGAGRILSGCIASRFSAVGQRIDLDPNWRWRWQMLSVSALRRFSRSRKDVRVRGSARRTG